MVPRSPDQEHRAATPLELFFDLVFVVAIAQAAGALHHAISGDHLADGVLGYAMAFFAIWWAWMNFTWFASAYDTDDIAYRLLALVQLTGALVLAAGITEAFEERDFTVVTVGYVVMRLALVVQWLRAAGADPARRPTCLRYAAGVALCQVGWVGLLFVPARYGLSGFLVMVLAELAVPVWAERVERTTWHPHHIAERYGLFTIIVLGESVLAATIAIETAIQGGHVAELKTIIAGTLLILFSSWWLYFVRPCHDLLGSMRAAFVWGYGHLVIFASAAAIGAGVAVAVDRATGEAEIGAFASGAAVAVPVALYLAGLWALQFRTRGDMPARHLVLPVAAAVLATPLTGAPVLVTGLLVAGLLVAVLATPRRTAAPEAG